MDKDEKSGHHIPTEIKKQYNICAKEAGLWREENLYMKEYKEQIKELRKNNISDARYLKSPYYDYPANTDCKPVFNRISSLTEGFSPFWDRFNNGKLRTK